VALAARRPSKPTGRPIDQLTFGNSALGSPVSALSSIRVPSRCSAFKLPAASCLLPAVIYSCSSRYALCPLRFASSNRPLDHSTNRHTETRTSVSDYSAIRIPHSVVPRLPDSPFLRFLPSPRLRFPRSPFLRLTGFDRLTTQLRLPRRSALHSVLSFRIPQFAFRIREGCQLPPASYPLPYAPCSLRFVLPAMRHALCALPPRIPLSPRLPFASSPLLPCHLPPSASRLEGWLDTSYRIR
jgi:hypothetical protein